MANTALFGGSFNPIHNGHLNCAKSVIETYDLDRIVFVPNNYNPLKEPMLDSDAQDRIAMLELALEDLVIDGYPFEIDKFEIEREGPSFTIDTILRYREEDPEGKLYFILGADTFYLLDKWKDINKIINECDLIVVSRPGSQMGPGSENVPNIIVQNTENPSKDTLMLKTGKEVRFLNLVDKDIASSELKNKIRMGMRIRGELPLEVIRYIREHKLYKPLKKSEIDSKKFVLSCGKHLDEKKAIRIECFDLQSLDAVTDYTIICSGRSPKHTSALAEGLVQHIKESFGIRPLAVEGVSEGRWVLIDYGFVILHFFYDFVREQYNLEGLWKEAESFKCI